MTARVGDYALLEVLGEGAFGKVRRAVHDDTGTHYAVKIMDKSLIRNHHLTVNVRREIAIMKAFQHPHIVSLHRVLSSETKLYVVLELVHGPELFELIANTPRGLPEPSARRYFQQLVEGVLYCHRRGVAHRDLKPENLLIDRQSGLLKITDFGLSSMKGADTASELLTTQCGTPHYIAPEIISQGTPVYDGRKVDAWACGIILFALLAGYLPFDETDLVCLFDAIRHGQFSFPPWISSGARDLIWRLLCVDPEARINLNEVTTHPWFAFSFKPSDPSFASWCSTPRTKLLSSGLRKRKHKRPPNPNRARNHDTPDSSPPLLNLELPDFKLPATSLAPLDEQSKVSADAALVARNEMMKSGRSMSFSARYTLLRQGIVTYGDISLPHTDGNRELSLGGIEQAKLRGTISMTGSSFYDSRATLSSHQINDGITSNSTGKFSANEASEEADNTMHVIRSLRTSISMTRSASRWYELSRNLASPTEEALLQKSTLISLTRLRNQLERFGEQMENNARQHRVFEKNLMSASQRQEMMRLLDVWESRIVRDAAPLRKNQSTSTRLSGEELEAFQALLLTWEMHFDGDAFQEDVLIPGSEVVEEEVPTTVLPDRLIQWQNHMEAKRTVSKAMDCGTLVDREIRHPDFKNSSVPVGKNSSINEETHHLFSQFKGSPNTANTVDISSEARCGDLNKLWNHVLVANTSKMGEILESDKDSLSSITKPAAWSQEPNSLDNITNMSPITEWHSSNDSEGDLTRHTEDVFQADQSCNPIENNRVTRNRENSNGSKHKNGSSGIRHHSRTMPRSNGDGSVTGKKSSSRRKFSTISVDSKISSKSVSAHERVRHKTETDMDENSFSSFRSSVGNHGINDSRARVSRQYRSRRQRRSDLGQERRSSSAFSSQESKAEHYLRFPKSRGMSSVSNCSLDDVEPRLVRSFGQRRIHTDLASDRLPFEVNDTASGLSALKRRICSHGWHQAHKGNLRNGQAKNDSTDGIPRSSEQRHTGRASSGLLARLFGTSRRDARFESGYNPRSCMHELSNTLKERGFSVARRPGENKLRVAVAGVDGRFITVSFDFASKGSGCVVRFRRTRGEKHGSRHSRENLVWGFYDDVLQAFRRSNEGIAVIDRIVR